MWIRFRDLEIFLTLGSGSGMENFGAGIRDKHPGSATNASRPFLGGVGNDDILLVCPVRDIILAKRNPMFHCYLQGGEL
jgi:hypothetical protein